MSSRSSGRPHPWGPDSQQGKAAANEGRPPGRALAVLTLLVTFAAAAAPVPVWSGDPPIPDSSGVVPAAAAAFPDTSGTGVIEWAYDSWTAPWVQVKGGTPALAAASHATFIALTCASAELERERLARHLSTEECEHRMAAIRADQDTALIFRLDLRVFDFPGAAGIARLDPRTTLVLEDDRGRSWRPLEVLRGPAVLAASGLKLRRVYYRPPWLRGTQLLFPDQYDPGAGRNLTVAEHRVRFARREPGTGDPVVSSTTRWIRMRLAAPGYEWVATWTFRPDAEERP